MSCVLFVLSVLSVRSVLTVISVLSVLSVLSLLSVLSVPSIHKQTKAVGVYIYPRQSSTTSKSAKGLQKVEIVKPLFWLTVGSLDKSSPRS